MKAIALKEKGSIKTLEYIQIDKPTLQHGEVLIHVRSISINPVDVKTRQGGGVYGKISSNDPLILGWDVSGIVEESRSEAFKIGDEVFGMVNFPGHGKAYAEYVGAPADQLALKPANISHEEAAGATLVGLTAWQVMVRYAKIEPGQNVLIHAAAGGVGHVAVQIAKHLGAHVTATSSENNKAFVMALGADEHVDYHTVDWNTQRNRFDFVLDPIGGEHIDRSVLVTRPGGTVISISSGISDAIGRKAQEKSIKSYSILVESSGADMKKIADLMEDGSIKVTVSKTFPFEDMEKAHAQLETHRTVGKIIVIV